MHFGTVAKVTLATIWGETARVCAHFGIVTKVTLATNWDETVCICDLNRKHACTSGNISVLLRSVSASWGASDHWFIEDFALPNIIPTLFAKHALTRIFHTVEIAATEHALAKLFVC